MFTQVLSRSAPVGTGHNDRSVRGSPARSCLAGPSMAGTSLPAMANLFAAGGAVSPARAAAPAQDAHQRVDPVTAVALPAANRRRCLIVNRSDRAGSSKPPVRRFPDFRSPAETLGRAHLPRVRTKVATQRSDYPSTCWCKGTFRTGQLGLAAGGTGCAEAAARGRPAAAHDCRVRATRVVRIAPAARTSHPCSNRRSIKGAEAHPCIPPTEACSAFRRPWRTAFPMAFFLRPPRGESRVRWV